MFKRGQVVTIYEDPITQTKPEGKAELIRRNRQDDGDGLEMWRVRFLDDDYITDRTLSNRPAPEQGQSDEEENPYLLTGAELARTEARRKQS